MATQSATKKKPSLWRGLAALAVSSALAGVFIAALVRLCWEGAKFGWSLLGFLP